ncbi:type I-F CRISPR-associated endonuclease Cas1f [Amantichitinum ursilacus]|uniref:CRISPR-associated endonuclease Cas1 n=1 Tax=Amantichitinum ursilacus TaxID=857265 RepID=A0A0N0XJ24_9NEIS|nr:type I-F CRISPR-associated endonuclease Cas1f [Amantichitinum ursilacus]KPC53220.1 CRISPR-associated endonuclease Cas1 [Amantichitinum ursilacus]
MSQGRPRKPQQILLSKRANLFYLEHARVLQKDERVLYLTETLNDIDQYFNIPERNTALLLLGKGCSITDAAVRRLAESNVMLGFCGSGGTPLFASTEPVFLSPQSEYGPTEYMQAWARLWFDEAKRLDAARDALRERIRYCRASWASNEYLRQHKVQPSGLAAGRFEQVITAAISTQDLLLAEAAWARQLYALLARQHQVDFSRAEGVGAKDSKAERINSFLDHGNYLAYGLAAVALNGLGISFCFPLLHGKTRRGALVFDIADLVKDALVMPLAFECGANLRCTDQEFRGRMIETLQESEALDYLFGFVKSTCQKYDC